MIQRLAEVFKAITVVVAVALILTSGAVVLPATAASDFVVPPAEAAFWNKIWDWITGWHFDAVQQTLPDGTVICGGRSVTCIWHD